MDPVIIRFKKKITELGRNEKVEVVSEVPKPGVDDFIKKVEQSKKIYVIKNEISFDMVRQKISNSLLTRVFLRDELVTCPMENIMVPQHNLVSPEYMDREMKMYSDYKFPRILFSDPIVRWNGWKCNSFIEITRKDGSKYYRHLYCSDECDCF